MAGNVQEKQLRWYNIALMSFITVCLCALFHTLCANCWSVRLDLQRWEGRGQYLD
ncbi:transporter [Escherichia coli]|nr:transporter [Escherichia coli]